VLSDRPHSYANLDNMCVYAHNVESKGYNVDNELSTQPVASTSDRSVRSGNPVSRATSVVCFRCLDQDILVAAVVRINDRHLPLRLERVPPIRD
jgi:hypothetical protein